jgi:hypothetical protein
MMRRSWLALAGAVAILAMMPALALAARPLSVTRGLDYLHAQQVLTTGGFSSPSATGWVILGAVASGERMGSSAWTHGGKNPVRALQATNHETAAAASLNPPQYYALMILAYMAGGREDYVYAAGTPPIDLLAKLYSYQDVTPGSETEGSFSPSSSTRTFRAVRTTAWAILAMHSLGIDNESFDAAGAWLRTQQNVDGGFGLSAGSDSDTEDTALAVQALRAGGTSASSALVQGALAYLDGVQRTDGGFPDQTTSSTRLSADATAFAIQAIDAAGENPASGRWRTSTGRTPLSALRGLQVKRGAFAARPGALISPVPVTGHAIAALSSQNFATYPARKPPAVKAFVYRPHFDTIAPKGGAVFRTTHIVLIRATYGDGEGGTGINADAVRLFVDSVNRTRPADVGRLGLHLQLKNVANGKHSYRIVIRDWAGNERQVTRTFTVAVPLSPTTPPTTPATFPPPTYHPTATPTIRPTITPTVTPTTILTPGATPSSSPSVSPSPSPSVVTGAPISSPSPSAGAGGAGGDDGGGSGGFIAGTLLAMLPLGAALTYYMLHRREDAMAGAVAGEQLGGGGSGWERTKDTFARSGDIIKPARS